MNPGMFQYNKKAATSVWVESLCCGKEVSAHTGPQTVETGVVSEGEGLDIRTVGKDVVL